MTDRTIAIVSCFRFEDFGRQEVFMRMRSELSCVVAVVLALTVAGCGTSRTVKKDSVKSIKNVAIISVYCPAAITIDNQRQAVGFHAVDAAVQAKMKRAEAMAEFRPRGLFLLNKAHLEAVEQFSRAFSWRVQPVTASIKAGQYDLLRQWSQERREKSFPMMMGFDGVAFLWVGKQDASLKALLKECCEKSGYDAVMILSFDFAYSKSWFGKSGISAKARTFVGVQIVDRNGELVVATDRADEREREYSVMADDTMPLKGWTADINDSTIKTFDSATKNSVANLISLLKNELY